MAKVVSVFNHKGGVGKTTLVYNLACRLAEHKKRCLVVDADPQCNLTSLAFPEEVVERIYANNEYTVATALSGLISGKADVLVSEPHVVPNFGIHVLAGDLKLSDFEGLLAREWNGIFKPEERAARFVSAIYRLCHGVAALVGAEFVVVDLGPSIGPLNQAALLASDFFLIPTTPDIYSVRAVHSVSHTVRVWADDYDIALPRLKGAGLGFQVPNGKPSFIGYVPQKFGIYRKRPAMAFQNWIDRLHTDVVSTLIPNLVAASPGPLVQTRARTSPRLADLQDYHSLVPAAQDANRPIFALRGNTDINAGHVPKVVECARDYDLLVREFLVRT